MPLEALSCNKTVCKLGLTIFGVFRQYLHVIHRLSREACYQRYICTYCMCIYKMQHIFPYLRDYCQVKFLAVS